MMTLDHQEVGQAGAELEAESAEFTHLHIWPGMTINLPQHLLGRLSAFDLDTAESRSCCEGRQGHTTSVVHPTAESPSHGIVFFCRLVNTM